ncbi:MAG: hypothetical protein OIF50_00635 [Flavobacteriaceae bacterium]|nr:hypothetical protein [Flavobacteriaceae bacterium]
MKNIIVVVLCIGSFISCKEQPKKNTVETNKISIKDSVKTIEKEPIQTFSISFSQLEPKVSKEFLEWNAALSSSFEDDTENSNAKDVEQSIKHLEENRFMGILSGFLKNSNFSKAKIMSVSFLKHQNENIRLIEWVFDSEKEPISCIKSLHDYKGVKSYDSKEGSIYFKPYKWIWIQHKNKLYLIAANNYRPSAKPMQEIRKQLISILNAHGSFQGQEVS